MKLRRHKHTIEELADEMLRINREPWRKLSWREQRKRDKFYRELGRADTTAVLRAYYERSGNDG